MWPFVTRDLGCAAVQDAIPCSNLKKKKPNQKTPNQITHPQKTPTTPKQTNMAAPERLRPLRDVQPFGAGTDDSVKGLFPI